MLTVYKVNFLKQSGTTDTHDSVPKVFTHKLFKILNKAHLQPPEKYYLVS